MTTTTELSVVVALAGLLAYDTWRPAPPLPRARGRAQLQRRYSWAWYLWFAWFGVVEYLALRNDTEGDTLSEHGWHWGSLQEHLPGWRLRRIGIVGGLLWLTAHIATGGWV